MEEKETTTLDQIKKIAGFVGTIGVGLLVSDAVDRVMPEDIKPVMKLLRKIGGWIISGMVVEAGKKYIFEVVDDTAETVTMLLEDGEDNNDPDPGQPEPAETVS